METQLKTLNIVQHNVRHCNTHKLDLCNTYQNLNLEIIVINSHGVKQEGTLKIHNNNIHKSNKRNELNDGVAIAICKYLKYIHSNGQYSRRDTWGEATHNPGRNINSHCILSTKMSTPSFCSPHETNEL